MYYIMGYAMFVKNLDKFGKIASINCFFQINVSPYSILIIESNLL